MKKLYLESVKERVRDIAHLSELGMVEAQYSYLSETHSGDTSHLDVVGELLVIKVLSGAVMYKWSGTAGN